MRRISFENFKSNVCHQLKKLGWIDFLIEVIENDTISKYWQNEWFPEAFYVLAMTDYVSRLHDVPLCNRYDYMRNQKLQKKIYPTGILLMSMVSNDESILTEAFENSIPEFKRFNIIENEVEKVA